MALTFENSWPQNNREIGPIVEIEKTQGTTTEIEVEIEETIEKTTEIEAEILETTVETEAEVEIPT